MLGPNPTTGYALLNGPVHDLLVSGGDTRMAIDPQTGLNRYGCAGLPRDVLPLGSCTASSPTARGIARAREVQRSLRDAAQVGDLKAAAHAIMQRQRRQLAHVLGVDQIEGARVILTPSGTDAEIIATWLALGDQSQPLCNIVAAPAEVGGGTTLAAGALHFDTITPHGDARVAGEPIAGMLAQQVRVQTIRLRANDGSVIDSDEFDAEAERQVDQAVADGERVLLHVVAHSKTGAHAPTLATVAALRERHGPDVMMVFIDAAQGRLSRKGLQDALSAGYMLMVTGSKFYGGPPFAGAVILPPGMTPVSLKAAPMPAGARDYFTAGAFPTEWIDTRDELSGTPNLGLVVRWAAALAEIEAYYGISASSRYAILRSFERMVPRIFGESPYVTIVGVPPPIRGDQPERLLESKTTVFPFYVHRRGAALEAALDRARLKRLYHWINVDASQLIPDQDPKILRRKFHIGQPVSVSPEGSQAMLRVALGGPLIVGLASDKRLGLTLESRIQWLEDQFIGLRQKLELLVEHFTAAA